MQFKYLPGLILSATAAVANFTPDLAPVGPIATFYSLPDYLGREFIAWRVDECIELGREVYLSVNSVKLSQFPSPYYVACTLYATDNCRDPAASAIYFATQVFDNHVIPNPFARSVSCKLRRLWP